MSTQSRIIPGDCRQLLARLKDNSVHCVVTSPPYFGLRDYGVDGQLGLESTPAEYVTALTEIFREIRRVLRPDGTAWLNLGDSYARSPGKGQHKPGDAGKQNYIIERGNGRAANTGISGLPDKNLLGIPWRVAFALQADGWYLRQDIIWSKPNPLPESMQDRCVKAHEYIFLLAKTAVYYFDSAAIWEDALTASTSKPWKQRAYDQSMLAYRQVTGIKGSPRGTAGYVAPGKRGKRTVWTIQSKPYKAAHFATFPPALIEPCILAGCPPGGVVLDPFAGAGTTGVVAKLHGRHFLGFELNPDYVRMAEARIAAAPEK